MRERLTRRDALESLLVLGLASQVGTGVAGARGGEDHHGPGEPTLNRFATTVAGAEITGLFLTGDGDLFFNVQHPGEEANDDLEPGAIGAVTGVDMNRLPRDFESVQPPEGTATQVKTARGGYQVLAEGQDKTVDDELLGIPYTHDGQPMTEVEVDTSLFFLPDPMTVTTGASPDFNGFVPSDGSDDEGYLFTNWETVPGMVSRLHVRQRSDGTWAVDEKRNLDFRDVEGTFNNCFGTVSPWGTPLTSEEYEPPADVWYSAEEMTFANAEAAMEAYLGYFGNPYRYGYIVEIAEPQSEDPTPTKHFTMGRFSHENAVVMPDEQTVYMSDDGSGTVFFKFEADEPGDLSAGTLYAAKANPEPGTDPEEVAFGIEWVELAHATDEQVESWIAEYDGQEPGPDADYITDAEVRQWANGNAADDRAAFLESRKAAAAKGATDEFRKMEGVNAKQDARPGDFLYMAMSEVNETMSDDAGTLQLQKNDYGAVYRMRLDGNYDVHRMEPVLVGGPDANVCGGCPYDAAPNSKSTVCEDCAFNPNEEATKGEGRSEKSDAKGLQKAAESAKSLAGKGMASLTDTSGTVDPENAIANPDNLVVMPDGRVVVGEDSDFHRPNMLWVYDPGVGE